VGGEYAGRRYDELSAKTNFQEAGDDLDLIERYTRVALDEIRYEVTVEAPKTWANHGRRWFA
jgi:hypothetical protein